MTVPYFARLVCLCLAAFFLLHLAFTTLAAALSRLAIRRARRMPARSGARLLFGLRMFPATVSSAVAGGVCAPSYLWFEPETALEQIGLACLAAAACAVAVCVGGVARGVRAAVRTARFRKACEAARNSDAPVLMLAGVFRPRLIVSRGVREALTPEQFAAAVRHEEGHGTARDNLKRLLIVLSPDAFPFVRLLRRLEQEWSRLAEWAADDHAVRGDRRQAVALAEALIRVTRMSVAPFQVFATQLLGNPADLAARVERLIDPRVENSGEPRVWPGVALAACGAAAAFQPSTMAFVHEALEALAH